VVSTLGLLLAAGAGRRMGAPKALLRDGSGAPFVARAVGALCDGGCDSVVVVAGAAAAEVSTILDETGWTDDPAVRLLVAEDWDEGMGASLRAGLSAARDGDASCAVVSLVDLPDVAADVVRRLLHDVGPSSEALARASYDGVPGHPVLIGRGHWAGVVETARGDAGARGYLAANPPVLVECGDLATGRDVDRPEHLGD
jgi:CTP:molybdopterin cytidylyltransferase MocA